MAKIHVPFLYALAPRWTSAVISLIATRPGALATAGADFPPFLGVSRSQIDFKHRALSHPLLICFNSLELTDGTSAVISLIATRPGALATAGADFPPFLGYCGCKLTSSSAHRTGICTLRSLGVPDGTSLWIATRICA